MFTKMAEVIPIDNTQPDEFTRVLHEMLNEMGIPKQLYSHEEGSVNSNTLVQLINEHDIKPLHTSTHAHTVERCITTFRDNVFRSFIGLNHRTSERIRHIYNTINTYTNTVHTTIQIEAVKAGLMYNLLWVNGYLHTNATSNRKYPNISKGDFVIIKLNQQIGTQRTRSHL